MKIALAQLNYHIGNFSSNKNKIIEAINSAKANQTDLIVFAELAVCGYPPRDYLDFNEFVNECEFTVLEIATHCEGIACILGSPTINSEPKGKNLFNSAYFLKNGKVEKIISKTLLPTYDIFDEYRYFEPNQKFDLIELNGFRIALTICEDLWNSEVDPMYLKSPMDELIKFHPDFMINIAASPFDYKHSDSRYLVLNTNCKKYNLPLFYVNQIGAQTELIFDGGSLALDSEGNIIKEMSYFKEDLSYFSLEKLADKVAVKSELPWKPSSEISDIEQIYNALILGIQDYFQKSGFSKAILGLSGGIDSAVVLALAVLALGKENVLAVMLPSKYSSDHSISDAEELVQNLGCKSKLIPIADVVEQFENTLKNDFSGLEQGIAEENIQSRSRAVLLMALSNKLGHILLNTSNKSEAAVGYGTLYGDMCGGISILADLYKTQVYELANFINKGSEIIPINSIIKPPSAELKPGQKDSDSLPDYAILDQILFQYIELRQTTSDIVDLGFDENVVKRIIKLVYTSEYKRHQTPPILRISPKAFGMGRKMPIVGTWKW